jgi:hypothetical protein
VVATLDADYPATDLANLCQELTDLSAALWLTYTEPATTPATDNERISREAELKSVGEVEHALRTPNVPDEAGLILVSYGRVTEASRRWGRVLLHLGNGDLIDAVVRDVSQEITAVDHAGLGDLSGRAAQATVLDRTDTSPVQVAAADAAFAKDPLGDPGLFTAFDPASACVAGRRCGSSFSQVGHRGLASVTFPFAVQNRPHNATSSWPTFRPSCSVACTAGARPPGCSPDGSLQLTSAETVDVMRHHSLPSATTTSPSEHD